MQRLAIATLFGLAAANNVVSPITKKCLDIKAMCAECDKDVPLADSENGCDRAGCTRQEPSTMTKGTRMQMWDCHNDENQNFEIIGGRAMNKAAGRTSEGDAELCIDIKAMCQEDADEDSGYTGCDPDADPTDPETGCDRSGCPRQSLDQIKATAKEGGEVDIQLWTCRDGTSDSSSFGNQKWNLLGKGYWKNEGTGLCLAAHEDEDGTESGADATNGAHVCVQKCPDEIDPEFIFNFEVGEIAEITTDGARLFSMGAVVKAKAGSPTPIVAAGACALVLAAAVAVLVRSRRSADDSDSQLPLTAE